ELAALLRVRHDQLSVAHRKIAQRVLADSESVAFLTVSEFAAEIGVNEGTIVRFATGLGLKGYPGLVRLCRERLRQQAQLLRRFEDLERLAAEGAVPRDRSLVLDQANLVRSFAAVDAAHWDSAVIGLARAPRVHVLGLRKCHAPAYLLGYLLGLVREEVVTLSGALGGLPDELRRVRPDDCFVAISIDRYSRDTVRAAEWAARRGAHVVALTDTPASPLAERARDAFYIEAASATVLRSMTAFTAMVQALTAEVTHALGHQARDTLLEEEGLLEEFGAYTGYPDD
ncbi:MAG: MurR/RpiR family transcriptional regulator, partial [Nocardia sp.]|nr:MurR/RpiR family transcriptional regulator [Nocardia sp.]